MHAMCSCNSIKMHNNKRERTGRIFLNKLCFIFTTFRLVWIVLMALLVGWSHAEARERDVRIFRYVLFSTTTCLERFFIFMISFATSFPPSLVIVVDNITHSTCFTSLEFCEIFRNKLSWKFAGRWEEIINNFI